MRNTNHVVSRGLLGLVALAALGVAAPARAQVVLYTNEAAFTAATSGLTTIDFNGLAPTGSYTYYGTAANFGALNVTNGGAVYVTDPAYSPTYYGFGTDDILTTGASAPSTTTMSTAGGFKQFGTNLALFPRFQGPGTITVTLSSGEVQVINDPAIFTGTPNTWRFFGFTSTASVASVAFYADYVATDSSWANFDNVRFSPNAAVTAVPEPGEWAAMGILAGGLGVLVVRKRRTA